LRCTKENVTEVNNFICQKCIDKDFEESRVKFDLLAESWRDNFECRPSWDEFLIGIELAVSRRSHDQNSQVGCVIADKEYRILGCGYNSFPRGMDDNILPRTRPTSREEESDIYKNKYLWMIHSETNALSNCCQRPEGATAYITHYPVCGACMMALSQQGIKRVVCRSKCLNSAKYSSDEQSKLICKQRNIRYDVVDVDLSWFAGLILNT
jgi:dCMP deaminase